MLFGQLPAARAIVAVTILGVLTLSATAESDSEITAVPNGVPDCPAFDVVQRQISEVSGGASSEEDAPSGDAAEPVAVEIIVDASGSMAAEIDRRRKMDLARDALVAALAKLDQTDALVALRAYGFDTTVEKTAAASCPNTALISGFSAQGASAHGAAAAALEPYGFTPIAASLAAAGTDLAAVPARDRMIILITDGEETCGGDPVQAAGALLGAGVAVATYVVGFDLDTAQRAQMEAIARNGGGAYFDAADARSLAAAIDQAVGVTLRKSERRIDKCLNPVAGGASRDAAVTIGPGLYTIGELLAKAAPRYYRLATKPGDHVTVRALLQSHRTYPGDDGMPFETAYALGSVTLGLEGPDGARLVKPARTRNIPGTAISVEHVDAAGSGVLIVVGDAYDWVAPDVLLAVQIVGANGKPVTPVGLVPVAGNEPAAPENPPAPDGSGPPAPVFQIDINQRATGSFAADETLHVWRVALPRPSDNAEGWLGSVALLVRPTIPNSDLRTTLHGERDGAIVTLAPSGGSAVLAQAAESPERPLDALLVSIENLTPGKSVPYDFATFAED